MKQAQLFLANGIVLNVLPWFVDERIDCWRVKTKQGIHTFAKWYVIKTKNL